MAPKRSRRTTKVLNNVNYSSISLSNALCPICRSILIQPVTLPCSHDFCSPCFEGTLANANLTCPLCRVRFGSWHRIAKKDNKIINEKLWNALQELFPKHVQNRLKGIEENLEEVSLIKLTTPGEIKKEYEQQKRNQELEEQKKKDEEEKASAELISKLKEQEEYEEMVREEKLRLDEKVARQIANEMGIGFVPAVASASKTSTLPKKKRPLEKPPTKSQSVDIPHYFSNIINKEIIVKQKNLNFTIEKADSNDSIENECKYFRPIDHRNIPPSKSVTILKVPAVIKTSAAIVRRSPSGNIHFTHSHTISAFARFELASPILGKPAIEVDKTACVQKVCKKRNVENKPQVTLVDKDMDLIEPEKAYDNLLKLSKPLTLTPKKRMSLRNSFQTEKPKPNGIVQLGVLKVQPRKRKISSPFIGFDPGELEGGLFNGHKRKVEANDHEKKERDIQEKQDLEFARKLQEEFNKERYTTRSSISCRTNININIKKTRQVTIPEIIATSKCK